MKVALFLLLILSQGAFLQGSPSPTPKPQHDLPKVTLLLGTNTLIAQIAADDASRELGLMSRTNLGDNEGMVFVFPQPRALTFWMKDTPLPLSIAYIGTSGRILEIYNMKPFDETPIPSASQSVSYALEVAKGMVRQTRSPARRHHHRPCHRHHLPSKSPAVLSESGAFQQC